MASTDISPVVARIKNRIESVADVGIVHAFDVYAHDDLRDLIVSEIAGQLTIRCWWITGPAMQGRTLTHAAVGEIERTWQYQIHGIEGLTASGDSIETLRSMALAVTDVLDVDWNLGGTAHRTDPCNWVVKPEHRTIIAGVGVAYVQIVKPVVTVSLPT